MAGPAITAIFHVSLRVTIDAPWHPHRRNSRDPVHGLHRPVTFLTLEPRLDVPFVRKVNEIGNVVHLDPRYRFTLFPVGCELQYLRTFANTGHELVTAHAFADAGDTGNGAPVGINVAMLTRDRIVSGMYLVTEFDWLDRTAVRKIFSVHPCAYEQTDHDNKRKQSRLLCRFQRIENGDRQLVPLSFAAGVCP